MYWLVVLYLYQTKGKSPIKQIEIMKAFKILSVALSLITLSFVYCLYELITAQGSTYDEILIRDTFGPLAIVLMVAGAVVVRRINLIKL